MSKQNEFMKAFCASLAEVVEQNQIQQSYAESSRRFLTTTAFTAREYDRELEAEFAMEYEAAKLLGIKL